VWIHLIRGHADRVGGAHRRHLVERVVPAGA
jgi:hypothetical protein